MSTQRASRRTKNSAAKVSEFSQAVPVKPVAGVSRDAQQRVLHICKDMRCARLAAQTGYHPETVRRYVCGAARMPFDFVVRLAAVLRINPRWLFTGQGSRSWDDPRSQALGDVSLAELLGEIATRLATREAHLLVSAAFADGSAQAAAVVDASEPAQAGARLSHRTSEECSLQTAEAKPLKASPLPATNRERWDQRSATARLIFERAG